MQKKIYVTGMDDDAVATKVTEAVRDVAGVTTVEANPAKCQVFVDCDDAAEAAVTAAIEGAGVTVLA